MTATVGVVLTAAISFVLARCSHNTVSPASQIASRSVSASSITRLPDYNPIDACTLLTSAEAETILQDRIRPTASVTEPRHGELLYFSRCNYAAANGARDLRIEIMDWSDAEDAVRQFANTRRQMENQVSRASHPVPALGDAAVLSLSEGSAAILFLHGRTTIGVGLTRTDPRSAAIQETAVIDAAAIVFDRFGSKVIPSRASRS